MHAGLHIMPSTLSNIHRAHACAPQRAEGGAPEGLETTLERVLSFLRVVKYKPPSDP